jgi:hypothetical protein
MGGLYENGSSRNGMDSMDCTDLAQNRERLRALVNAVKNLRVPSNAGNFLTGNLSASQDEPLSMEFDSYGIP